MGMGQQGVGDEMSGVARANEGKHVYEVRDADLKPLIEAGCLARNRRSKQAVVDLAILVSQARDEIDRLREENEAMRDDISAFGVALGHADVARPESGHALMTAWTVEVAALRATSEAS